MKIKRLEVVRLSPEQCTRVNVAVALATCNRYDLSDVREEILQAMSREFCEVAVLIGTMRIENQ